MIYTKIKFSQVKYASFARILKDNLLFCTNSYNLKYIISAINKEEELKIYLRMKRINLIENYIWEFYDVLHTQSRNSTLKKKERLK